MCINIIIDFRLFNISNVFEGMSFVGRVFNGYKRVRVFYLVNLGCRLIIKVFIKSWGLGNEFFCLNLWLIVLRVWDVYCVLLLILLFGNFRFK